ncbi:MAG TPA: sulfurtransferase complex subunit TusB [Cycloclasticus sp.]|jgi:tRNA 2-thiouridine synthesizing protein B|nr:sulfurtransferase complex subunit TusB [Cycloclasticus sp.]
MLFIINKNSAVIGGCIAKASADDVVLLIEDAVFAVIECGESPVMQRSDNNTAAIYALSPDMQARGVREAACHKHIKFVDYTGFVELVVNHNPVRSIF